MPGRSLLAGILVFAASRAYVAHSEVSWRYLFMNFLLFVEKEGLGCPSSPQLFSGAQSGGLLHLLYESKRANKRLLLSR